MAIFACKEKSCPPETISLNSSSVYRIPYSENDSLVFVKTADTISDTFYFRSEPPNTFSTLDYKNESGCRIEIQKEIKEYKLNHPGTSLIMRLSLVAGVPNDSLHIYFGEKHFSIAASDIKDVDTTVVSVHHSPKDSSIVKYLPSKGIVRFQLTNPNEAWKRIY